MRAGSVFLCAGLLAALLLMPDGGAVHAAGKPGYALHPSLAALPPGRWTIIHQQRPGDAVTFAHQAHGGSAFDSRRGQLVLFGADTHAVPGGGWLNGLRVFGLEDLTWRQPYADDAPETYRVTREGLPVAGRGHLRPWAMHTFGAVEYDPATDALVVASYPDHLVPGRFTDRFRDLWPRIVRHPTWVLDRARGLWRALPGAAVHFFAFSTAYDSRRNRVIGYSAAGVYALRPSDGSWRRLAQGGLVAWGSNTVYDSKHDVVIAWGDHAKSDHVTVFEVAKGRQSRMPTPGERPPGASYVPMAFHAALGRTVALVERLEAARSETWLYDFGSDSWTQVASAALPFGVGLNYNLDYVPVHALLLLVATPPGETLPAVWALRLEGGR